MADAGLIAVRSTEKDQLYPERTVYELTDAGQQARIKWLANMISTPRREFPEFPAALSFLMMLVPARAREVLADRRTILEGQLEGIDATLNDFGDVLPRIALVEDEYRQTVLRAEIAWISAIIDDLDEGRLDWDEDLLRAAMAANPPSLGDP